MNQNPPSDPQRLPSPPRDEDREIKMQRRYRRVAVARVSRPWFYCGCLVFLGLIVLLIVLVVRGQPSAPASLTHAVNANIQQKHASNVKPVAVHANKPAVNTALRFAKAKRNENGSSTKLTKDGEVAVASSAVGEEGAAEPPPALENDKQTHKKKPGVTPHHFYHDSKKHGKKD